MTRQTEEGTFMINIKGELLNSRTEWHQPKLIGTSSTLAAQSSLEAGFYPSHLPSLPSPWLEYQGLRGMATGPIPAPWMEPQGHQELQLRHSGDLQEILADNWGLKLSLGTAVWYMSGVLVLMSSVEWQGLRAKPFQLNKLLSRLPKHNLTEFNSGFRFSDTKNQIQNKYFKADEII